MTTPPPILAYAPPARRPIGRYIGLCAATATVLGSTLTVAITFATRYQLASGAGLGGRCGTPRATLQNALVTLPAMLFFTSLLTAAVADYLHAGPVACRVALLVAVLGWATCAFIG